MISPFVLYLSLAELLLGANLATETFLKLILRLGSETREGIRKNLIEIYKEAGDAQRTVLPDTSFGYTFVVGAPLPFKIHESYKSFVDYDVFEYPRNYDRDDIITVDKMNFDLRDGAYLLNVIDRTDINSKSSIIIGNAVSFNASVYYPFDADQTQEQDFAGSGKVPMMRQTVIIPF